MSNTANIGLPLLQPAQAQKHVTVNEGFAILDGLACLTLKSIVTTTPPGGATDGDTYHVPPGGVNAWAGQDGKLAVFANGGWLFVVPRTGWRGWIEDAGSEAIFDGVGWRQGAVAISAGGAATVQEIIELDHVVASGATSTVSGAVANGSVVIGVTARVTTALTGSLTSWRLGVAGSDDRYGTGYGTALGSWARGLTSGPLAYYSETDLILSAEGGVFDSGDVTLAIHLMRLELPA